MTISAPSTQDLLIAKPPLVSYLTNRGSTSPVTNVTIPSSISGWTGSITLIEALSCTTYLTESNGDLNVEIRNGEPRVFIAASQRGELCAVTLPNGNSSTSTETTGYGFRQIGGVESGLVVLMMMVLGSMML